MSKRARFETSDGNHLTVSRGGLSICEGATGQTREMTLVGSVTYDQKLRKLSAPIRTADGGSSVMEFSIAKDAATLRAESLREFVKTEQGRLVNLHRAENSADTTKALAAFCARYKLDQQKVLGVKEAKPAPAVQATPAVTEETPVSAKPRKKAKDRRAEEQE